MPEAMTILNSPERLAREMVRRLSRPRIERVTRNFDLDTAFDTLFGPSPDWTSLNDTQKAGIIAETRPLAGDRALLPVPSTALIGVARR
jgi:hypothetical protein